jgi:TetR/AcrR family transcriptional regulator, cholesterol catabolism regulator
VAQQTAAVAGTASQRERRRRIAAAAQALLEEREYDRIQIRDVAEAAGVALGTLYRYFPSKEQLFAHVLMEWSAGFETTLRRRQARTGDAERLRLALRRAAAAFERHPHFFRLIAVLEVVDDPGVAGPFRTHGERFTRALADTLPDVHPDDVAVIATMAQALLSTLLRSWAQGRRSMADVYEQLDRSVALIFGTPRVST